MEVTDANVQLVAEKLQQTLSPDPVVRKSAEQYLKTCEDSPNYGILLMTLVSNEAIPMVIRTSGSVYFKNYVKEHWNAEDHVVCKITDVERTAIRSHIVNLMLRSPEQVQRQLSDAISVIGRCDFPERWPNLLNELVSYITNNTGDFRVINGVLQTAHSLFKRYRHEFKSQRLWTEIRQVIDTFAKPFTELFVKTVDLAKSHAGNAEALKVIFGSLALCAKIFYSLNVQDLPDVIEDNLSLWMTNFSDLLSVNNALLNTDTDEEAGLLEQLKAQICEVVSLYASQYSEEFEPYLANFVEKVWGLLKSTGPQVKYDLLVSISMKFLTTVASRPPNKKLFEVPGILDTICSNIIIPNMVFRDSDEEQFEENPEEFIRQDMEGSDVDTRRRAACDLVKALRRDFEPQITSVFDSYIQQMLQEYANNPTGKWRNKDAAVYLVTSMAVKGSTVKSGTTSTSDLVNVVDFYVKFIKPELERPNLEQLPVLKASALKYLVTFRNQFSCDTLLASLPLIIAHLRAKSMVIHTYAANALEKIFTMKDAYGKSIIPPEMLTSLAGPIFEGLFLVLTIPGSEQNDYVMKAILKTIVLLQGDFIPYLQQVLNQIMVKLNEVCKNPSKPHFNHYLFETIALSVKITCDRDASALTSFESMLFPIAQLIFVEAILEFTPYAFQLLSQLLEYYTKGNVPPSYSQLFELFLAPDLWDKPANIQPMVRFLVAFIQRAPDKIVEMNKMEPLLGVFQKLIASKSNDHHGFAILQALVLHADAGILTKYIGQIFLLLFQRLTSSKTVKYVKNLLVFLSLFAFKFSPRSLVEVIESLQPGMFKMVVDRLFVPELPRVTGTLERKICAVGVTKILCENDEMINSIVEKNEYQLIWQPLFSALMSLFQLPSDEVIPNEDEKSIEVLESTLDSGYQASFAQLAFCGKREDDPFEGQIPDAGVYCAQCLHGLSTRHPGKFVKVVSQTLTPPQLEVLQRYLAALGVTLV